MATYGYKARKTVSNHFKIGEALVGQAALERKPILISTICANCACYLALAFAQTWWAAFLIRLGGGLFSGNGSVIQGYISDVTPPTSERVTGVRTRNCQAGQAACAHG